MKKANQVCAVLAWTALAVVQAYATDGVWVNAAGGNWTDAANWQDGAVADGSGATASFPDVPTQSRIVVLPSGGVTLGKLAYNRGSTEYQVRFRGGPILFDAASPEIDADYYFAIFYNDLQGSNGLIWRYGGVIGTDTSYTGPTTLSGGIVYDYMHLGAPSQSSSISNYLSTGPLVLNGGSLVVSGRRNTSAASSDWVLTAGDVLVQSAGSQLAASPGASVTGSGIPEGTFVKHNIDNNSFELSQPATLSGTSTLSFGAVTGSESHQQFEKIEVDANGFVEIANNGGSLTRVAADDLTGGLFTTLTLQGDGTLSVKGGEAFGGTLSLNGGTFEHLAKAPGVQPVLTNVALTARTFFSVPDAATTSTLVNVSGSGELVKSGAGSVVMKSTPGPNSHLTVEDGTLTLTTQALPTNLVEGAWFHVDAGDPASLTLVNENGTNFVTQWRDTRTNGVYASAASNATRPFLREGFQNGLPVVDFGSFNYVNRIAGYGGYLDWNQECTSIREAFLVFSDTEDCLNIPSGINWSFLLGHYNAYHFHRNFYGVLFHPAVASPNLLNGVIAVDGVRGPYSTALTPGFHVVSLSPTGPVAASTFARDRDASRGGQRLAEVLVFDHALSDSQRRDVGAYLMNKWLGRVYPGYRSTTEPGVGQLKLDGDGVFTVGTGEELRVGELDLGGDIVKNGAGTLTAGVIHETGGSLSVAEGAVTISKPAVALTAPASDPWFHVDAGDPASLTLVNENGTNFVTQWRDTRTNGLFAAAAEGAARPFLRNSFQNGLPVIDFGSFRYAAQGILGYGAYLNWSAEDASIRDVFLVFSDTEDCVNIPASCNWSFLLGHDWAYDFHRNSFSVLFNSAVTAAALCNGGIAVDAAPGTYSTALTPGFHVVSLSPTGPVRATTFARDRGASSGGQRLAEVLVYNRSLGAQERRDTENYLLRKWMGRTAPGYAGGTVELGGMTYAGDAQLAIDSDAGHVSLGQLQADGSLVKSGAGSLDVGVLGNGVDSVNVSGGNLTVSGVYPGAWFHVDAGDPASLTLVNENGTNFVTQWRDTRTNGVCAVATDDASRPFLRANFLNGLPVMDFGSFRYANQGILGYGGHLNWNQECTAIREVFMVFSDTPDCVDIPVSVNWSFLLGHYGAYNFHRGGVGSLLNGIYSAAELRNGPIVIDGETATYDAVLSSGFHVISFSPTGPVSASNFANDRGFSFGGQRLAEVLIYTHALSDAVRQGIRQHLFSKWENRAQALAQLRAAAGSQVTFGGGALSVGAFEGEGRVSVPRVTASAVSAGDAAGEVGTLALTGALELADGAVVTADCVPPAGDRVDVDGALRILGGGTFVVDCPEGSFNGLSVTLFTFGSIEGASNLSKWTVTGSACSRYSVKPVIVDSQLKLTFAAKGTWLLLR